MHRGIYKAYYSPIVYHGEHSPIGGCLDSFQIFLAHVIEYYAIGKSRLICIKIEKFQKHNVK